jgi:hypothetical protein
MCANHSGFTHSAVACTSNHGECAALLVLLLLLREEAEVVVVIEVGGRGRGRGRGRGQSEHIAVARRSPWPRFRLRRRGLLRVVWSDGRRAAQWWYNVVVGEVAVVAVVVGAVRLAPAHEQWPEKLAVDVGGAERCVGSCDRNGSAEGGVIEVAAHTAAVGSCWRGRGASNKQSEWWRFRERDGEGQRWGREHRDVLH